MHQSPATRPGGRILVECLERQGATHAFCVPGESYLAVLDALHDAAVKVVVCRQEGGAAMMAEAAGKLTGRPGLCFVTRGPGATNASAGVHIAQQDSTPMILFIGQVERAMRERDAFQEVDYKAFFGGIAKWVGEIPSAERIPEFVSRAFHVAMSGRPGPVVLALPEDVLTEMSDAPAAGPAAAVEAHPGPADMARLQEMLSRAERPFAVLGGARWSEDAVAAFARFAERFALPVGTSFRRQTLFDPLHPCYAGDVGLGVNPRVAERVKNADVLLLIGTRLSEASSTSYTLLDIPEPKQKLVHVLAGPEELGRVYHPALAINASPSAFALAAEDLEPPREIPWAQDAKTAHQDYLAWSEEPLPHPGPVQMGEIVRHLRDTLPQNAVVTNGAGNYATWLHRHYRSRRPGLQLAPTSGSMGYGLPAAIAAKALDPDRAVIAFAGDGCFLMTGQEFATAAQHDLPVVVIVVNNGMYGTIRMHQERDYPGRVSATTLVNPDFAAYARAFRGHGETVTKTDEFPQALERAIASKKPAIIELALDPEAILPARTLSDIRNQAR